MLNHMRTNVIIPIIITSNTPELFLCRIFSFTSRPTDYIINLTLKISYSAREVLKMED